VEATKDPWSAFSPWATNGEAAIALQTRPIGMTDILKFTVGTKVNNSFVGLNPTK
jgi:hypothetical protein